MAVPASAQVVKLMKRIRIEPRQGWQQKIEDQGFVYYKDYYNESAAYAFHAGQIDALEEATEEIFRMCSEVVKHVIDNQLWADCHIPEAYAEMITASWQSHAPSLYGRMDLAYNGRDIKLLEFNADTPTSLLEASVIQWYWLQDYHPEYDQFNSIHEKLLDSMQHIKPQLLPGRLFFSCVHESDEDYMTVKYLEDLAAQSGIDTGFLYLNEIGIDDRELFCTTEGELIRNIFKLYPWEWLFREEFGPYLVLNRLGNHWIEPAYKAILSNKMLLHFLYELFPHSPYILPCRYGAPLTQHYVKKPVFSREGANITIHQPYQADEQTGGDYGDEGFVYQEYFPIPTHHGFTPVIGSWVIGGQAAGIGIRESAGRITDNRSLFCPHYFVD